MSPAFDFERGWERPGYSLPSRRRNRDRVVSDRESVNRLGDIEGDGGRGPIRVLEKENDALGVVEDVVDVGGVEGLVSGSDPGLGEDLFGNGYVSHED